MISDSGGAFMNFNVRTTRAGGSAAGALALLALTATLADARPVHVLSSVHLRQGPGTTYGILRTIPAGSTVEVTGCSAEWCTVHWNGSVGYSIARNLALGGSGAAVVAAAPAVVEPAPVVVGPPIVYGPRYYWGPPYYWGPRYRWGWRHW
jgi:uncharacterized protein YraI